MLYTNKIILFINSFLLMVTRAEHLIFRFTFATNIATWGGLEPEPRNNIQGVWNGYYKISI